MRLPEYVSIEQVQRVCRELGLRDWTQLTETKVQPEEAGIIQAEVGGEAMQISLDEFRRGLEVELEHGLQFPDANVTNNHQNVTSSFVTGISPPTNHMNPTALWASCIGGSTRLELVG